MCCKTQVCALGSLTLGLVAAYGERASGPCPALTEQPDGAFACGLILRPRDYAPGRASIHDLREAAKVLIGAGIGCDDVAEDVPEGSEELEIMQAMQRTYIERVGVDRVNRAVKRWYGL